MSELTALLEQILGDAPTDSLWCVDENQAGYKPSRFCGSILTNRFDIAENLQAQANCHFSDFDLSPFPANSLSLVIFRIAKEKAINLHILSGVLPKLPEGGRLLLVGHKNEGILSLASRAEESGKGKTLLQKVEKQLYLLEVSPLVSPEETLPEEEKRNDYATLQLMNIDNVQFFSKPGIFGWNKIDAGSRLLMQAVERHHAPKPGEKVLDLGCGYGYLSIRAHQIGFRQIDATDNNAAAIRACRQNFSLHNIAGCVEADDMASHNPEKYQVILCNPPFHQGFDHHKALTASFTHRLSSLLAPNGEVFLVTNQFIGVEKIASGLFPSVELLEKSSGFKVLRLSR